MQKITPTARIECYPLSDVGRWRKRSFSLTDRLSSLNRGTSVNTGTAIDGTSGSGVIGFNGQTSQPEAAAQGGDISDISDLEWVKLDDELDKTYLSGFVVRPRYCPLNSIIDAQVNPPTDKMCLRWKANGNHWTTCLPDAEPAATGIRWYNTTFDYAPWARTTKNLPAGQDFRVRLWLDGIAKSPSGEDRRASFRLVMGGTGGQYSLYWVDGLSTHLSMSKNEVGTRTPIYKALREANFLDGFWGGSPIEFDVRHVAGRLYFVGEGGSITYTQRVRGPKETDAAQMTEGRVDPVKLGEGPLQIEPLGCSVGMVVSEIAYADTNIVKQGESQPYEDDPTSIGGSFTRKFFAGNRVTMTGAEAYVHGYAPANVAIGSYLPTPDASAVGTVTPDPTVIKGRVGQYTCTVNAVAERRTLAPVPDRDGLWEWDQFAMRGHSTAFVHQVSLQCRPVQWLAKTSDPVDIRPAVESMNESCVDPAIQPGSQWNARIDRTILKDVKDPLGVSLGNDYGTYIGRYHPIVVKVAWVYEDGVQRAYAQQGGATYQWLTRLSGFQVWPAPRTDKPSERWLDASWTDPVMLLRAPYGIVDQRFAPLDFLMAQKLNSGVGGSFYGRDAIAYILRLTLGDAAANALYPYAPMAGQYSLLDYKIYTDPPSGGGFLWPPPFGQSAWQWIQQIGEWDFSVFYFAIATADGKYRPIYGNYFELVRGLPTTSLPDAVYASGDEANLIGGMETTGVPEQDFNRWLVWGQAPGQPDLGGLMPALPAFSAEARIETSPIPEQNIAATGERTQVKQGTQYWLPRVAKRVANNNARIMTGVNARRISLHVPRGCEWLWWGHKVTVPLNATESDLGIDLRGKTLRGMKINNRWDFKQQQFQQTVNVAEQPVKP